MLDRSIETLRSGPCSLKTVFFDRGIGDLRLLGARKYPHWGKLDSSFRNVSLQLKGFSFSPVEGNIQRRLGGKQSFDVAVSTYEAMVKAYSKLGYELIEIWLPSGVILFFR